MDEKIILFKAVDHDHSDKYVEYLEKYNCDVKLISPITFSFCNLDVLQNCLKNPCSYSGIILTSPRCVKAVSNAMGGDDTSVQLWNALPTFVVGETTDELARKLGLSTEGKDCGDAEELGKLIAGKSFEHPLLYPLGNLAKDTIKLELENVGISVFTVVVYETINSPTLEESIMNSLGNVPLKLVFFSPSGVESVLTTLRKHNMDFSQHKFYAIGRTTEKSLFDNKIPVSGTAEKPTPVALFKVLSSS